MIEVDHYLTAMRWLNEIENTEPAVSAQMNFDRAIYSDDWRADMAIAEMAYYYTHSCLPEWALVIEAVEVVGLNTIFVHRDLTGIVYIKPTK